jgi:deazaflavin-dependent oxidoreductase (nitroreductase family)
VRGRKSGEWRRTPVNPLEYEGERYIVAPRGETQWVRNLRASGEGRLRKGRGIEEFTATELPDDEKVLLLRAYLKKWGLGGRCLLSGCRRRSARRRPAPDRATASRLSDLAPPLAAAQEQLAPVARGRADPAA